VGVRDTITIQRITFAAETNAVDTHSATTQQRDRRTPSDTIPSPLAKVINILRKAAVGPNCSGFSYRNASDTRPRNSAYTLYKGRIRRSCSGILMEKLLFVDYCSGFRPDARVIFYQAEVCYIRGGFHHKWSCVGMPKQHAHVPAKFVNDAMYHVDERISGPQ